MPVKTVGIHFLQHIGALFIYTCSLIFLCPAGGSTGEPPLKFDLVIHTGSMLTPAPLIQDRDGFIWVGAQGSGLIKFDGSALKRYTAGPGSIPDDNVTSLYEDRDGNIWIGTFGGLSRYDKRTNTFVAYLHDPADSSSIGSNVIHLSNEKKAKAIGIREYVRKPVVKRELAGIVRKVLDGT